MILFQRPRWMLPVVYGGPSTKKIRDPSHEALSRVRRYFPCASIPAPRLRAPGIVAAVTSSNPSLAIFLP
jgi:hypothetical protein